MMEYVLLYIILVYLGNQEYICNASHLSCFQIFVYRSRVMFN